MATTARIGRQKISTTIGPKTAEYLQQLIENSEATTLAEAVDLVIERLLVYENRERLARDTAAYFDGMSPDEAAEEESLGAALAASAKGIDFDREP